jgi:hypothetical protein
MKSVYILGILLFAVFILLTYQSYSLNNLYNDNQVYEEDRKYAPIANTKSNTNANTKNIDYSKGPAHPGQLKALSQLDGNSYQNSQCDAPIVKSSVHLYQEDEDVQNKGFVNELIFKPESNSALPYAPIIIEKQMPLNTQVCVLSTDLPIANINVNYFLDKNTTKLRS